MVAVAGRFREPGGVVALATRVGAISASSAIRYWSVSRKQWRPLFARTHALASPAPETRRADFHEGEIREGAELHFLRKENNPSGPIVYRLVVRERSADRLVVGVANVSPARVLLIPLFDVGEQELITFLVREDDETWRYYAVTRVGAGPDPNAEDHVASVINRAVAIFRHMSGTPTDREPPAAFEKP
jgi:hypothetical protein